jgi:hypothetical protein
MSNAIEIAARDPKMSFYDKAVWYVFIAPLVAVAIACVITGVAEQHSISDLADEYLQRITIGNVLLIQIVSFIFMVFLICKMQRHKRKLTIWVALFGAFSNCVMGLVAVIAFIESGLG